MHNKTYIIAGHYGSGKTEFAINFAYHLKAHGKSVAVADVDIVNPYFRIRQKAREMEAAGITTISNNFDNDWRVDVPSLSRMVQTCFTRKDRSHVIDVGGNGVGAKLLARFRDYVEEGDCELWMVVNARRFETQAPEQALQFLRDIEEQSCLRVTGLINNTHFLRETSVEDVLAGEEMVCALNQLTGIPCIYTSCIKSIIPALQNHSISGELFPITLHMRPSYI